MLRAALRTALHRGDIVEIHDGLLLLLNAIHPHLEVDGRRIIHSSLQDFLRLLQELHSRSAPLVCVCQVLPKFQVLFLQLLKFFPHGGRSFVLFFRCLRLDLLILFNFLGLPTAILFGHAPNDPTALRLVQDRVVRRLHWVFILSDGHDDPLLQHGQGKLNMRQAPASLSDVGHLLSKDASHLTMLLPDATNSFLSLLSLSILLHRGLLRLLLSSGELSCQLVHLLLASGEHALGSLQLPRQLLLCLPQLLRALALCQLLLALLILPRGLELLQAVGKFGIGCLG
mmetsp:Transcript_52840/g.98992  ORF Transcript_52840/g.98992 Transcript_52840/m.98992 type:complete len:285 (-) Transcript_52840:86-940(-)